MKKCIYIISVLFFFCQVSKGNDNESQQKKTALSNDSLNYIIDQALLAAPGYGNLIEEYTAKLYSKGYINIKKSNILINYIPFMFKRQRGIREYITESYSDLHYTAPNIFDRKIKACNGTIDKLRNFNLEMMDYFDINVYSNSLFNVKLISPLSQNARKYYHFKLDSIHLDENGEQLFQLSFNPKYSSYQLIEGYFVIHDNTWKMQELTFTGRSEYLDYTNKIEMGHAYSGSENFLPAKFDSKMSFHLLGNVIEGNFTIYMDYDTILLAEKDTVPDDTKKKLDLTKSFTLQHDTSTIVIDSGYFAKFRPFPLSEKEQQIYQKYYTGKQTDSIRIKNREAVRSRVFWGDVGDLLVGNYSINSPYIGKVRFSPLLNPLSLSYSGKDGLSYKHKVRYQRLFNQNRLILNIAPMIGYNVKHKEFYWRVPLEFEYLPQKRGSFSLNIGNGNRIYNSEIVDEIKDIPDSLFDYKSINLEYFRDFYIDFFHNIEVVNGLTIEAGASVHHRKAIDSTHIGKRENPPVGSRQSIEDEYNLRNSYVSFAPRIKISWTPQQYYYMADNRKINLYSKWPTFSFDYERGIKGVFSSSGQFERMEFDMQHSVPLGLLCTLYYRAGGGIFTNKEELFFVDFRNFEKNNLPSGWNDDIGGTFQNLDRFWYNSSKEYLRANITYESPFLLTSYIFKRLPNILNERIYINTLVMPHLNPYLEIGYGIGTHFFDFGMFLSNKNGKFYDFGIKLTLELFNR